MQHAATMETKELRIMISLTILAVLIVLFGIVLDMPTRIPSSAAHDQPRVATQPSVQNTITFVSGSERYRAEACSGLYACDEDGTFQ